MIFGEKGRNFEDVENVQNDFIKIIFKFMKKN